MSKTKQQQLDEVDKVLASGVENVRDGEKSTQFRSVDDLLRIRQRLAADVADTGTPVSCSRPASFQRVRR